MREKVDAIVREFIRPQLQSHGGDIDIISVKDGVVRFRFKGQCAGCPAADLTTEELIKGELTERLPAVKDVVLVHEIDEDLIAQARAFLKNHGG